MTPKSISIETAPSPHTAATVEPGLYKLVRAVANPKGHARAVYDWKRWKEIPQGTLFVVTADDEEVTLDCRGRPGHLTVSRRAREGLGVAIFANLERVSDPLGDLLRSVDFPANRVGALLRDLLERGCVKPSDILLSAKRVAPGEAP